MTHYSREFETITPLSEEKRRMTGRAKRCKQLPRSRFKNGAVLNVLLPRRISISSGDSTSSPLLLPYRLGYAVPGSLRSSGSQSFAGGVVLQGPVIYSSNRRPSHLIQKLPLDCSPVQYRGTSLEHIRKFAHQMEAIHWMWPPRLGSPSRRGNDVPSQRLKRGA